MSKICFIGSGNMAEAIIGGIISSSVFPADDIIASDIDPEKLIYLNKKYGIRTTNNDAYIINKADIIVLSVKPQSLNNVATELASYLKKNVLIISILAGININKIATMFNSLSSPKIARVMPNLGALTKKSASAICFNDSVDAKEQETIKQIFNSIGFSHFCDETQMDAVTAISGSGPAYLFYFIEVFIQAAKNIGFNEDEAQNFCLETLKGATSLLELKQNTPLELRKKVTSKGGTTEAALNVFINSDFKTVIENAVKAAYNRSQELGKKC